MNDWEISLKWYPHFDAPIPAAEAMALVKDRERVAANTFYPFMLYNEVWQPYRSKPSGKPAKKRRPIRFASRRDAYILSYYRHVLSQKYEQALSRENISDVAIAYRKLKTPDGRGKSNIEFAKDAFDGIAALGNCAVVASDISSFFEHIDHQKLLAQWCRVLSVAKLPADHEAIFKAMTSYAVVDREAVYRRLGYLEDRIVDGKLRAVYTKPYAEMPKKLCSNKDFQEKICGRGGKFKSLIDVNRKPWGIPQGAPISDLLANLYLIDFDVAMKKYCSQHGGFYLRYSDDLLLALPGGDAEAHAARDFIENEIAAHGQKLRIKDKKTAVLAFERAADGRLGFRHIGGCQGSTGLEYLGFRFDGREVLIRNSTLSSLYRKISGGIKAESYNMVARFPGKGLAFLFERFDFSAFYQRYGRVKDFDPHDVHKWTFWTYARRAQAVFGKQGLGIPKQLRNFRRVVKRRVIADLAHFHSMMTR